MSKSRHLGVIVTATQKNFSYLLIHVIIRAKFRPPTPTLAPGRFLSKSNGFLPWSEGGRAATKNEVDRFNIFLDILLTDTQTHMDRQKDKRQVRNPAMQSMGGV